MASTVVNLSCNVGATKVLDRANYMGLKSSMNSNFVCVRSTNGACNRRLFVVRASEMHDGPIKKMGLSDAECEAAVVAGNVPKAPPVPPMPVAPAGTPVVPTLVSIIPTVVTYLFIRI